VQREQVQGVRGRARERMQGGGVEGGMEGGRRGKTRGGEGEGEGEGGTMKIFHWELKSYLASHGRPMLQRL
jgi:hypothetical protein